MRYFIDTEFAEKPHSIHLISIAIVAEDGREFYAEVSDFDPSLANEWVSLNVLPHLTGQNRMPLAEIGPAIRAWVGYDKPEFWGYYADYDWVVFCWLFGAMIDLPKGWPMYCRDLKQLCDDRGNPRLPDSGEHNALRDARWIRDMHAVLSESWLDKTVGALRRIEKLNNDVFSIRVLPRPLGYRFQCVEIEEGHEFVSGLGATIEEAAMEAFNDIESACNEWDYEM